ncbi:MAG: nucleotide exchange factor GrpE [Candidatus Cloacimonetes bacterium]|nr:nucleotide exchange factor GrpE [Candidatus Cloacimonadota bacterium]
MIEIEETNDKTEESNHQQNGSGRSKKQKPILKDKVERLEKEVNELKDQKLRLAAEFDNFRRRSVSEKASWIKNANERLVLEICDIRDNFERALSTGQQQNDQSLLKGVELIFQQLEALLKREGVTKIEAEGEDFDPRYHEAIVHIPSLLPENKVTAVIQNGYIMNERVIRAARVAVSNGEKSQEHPFGNVESIEE